MAADVRGLGLRSFALLAAAALLGCNNVDVAGTLVEQGDREGMDQGGAGTIRGSSGAWGVDRRAQAAGGASGATSSGGNDHSDGGSDSLDGGNDRSDGGYDPSRDAGGEQASDGLTCEQGSEWLLFLHADLVTLSSREESAVMLNALEMLYVDEDCTFWVLGSSLGDEIRTGALDAAEAEDLWMDLGTDARAGLSHEEVTSRVGTIWMIQDSTDQLSCLGECDSERVDVGVGRLFELAGQWVITLYERGEVFAGSVEEIGLPVE